MVVAQTDGQILHLSAEVYLVYCYRKSAKQRRLCWSRGW